MLKEQDPLEHYKDLRRGLRARKAKIYRCDECDYVWIASSHPQRCANKKGNCRAGATVPKRDHSGRPGKETD